MLRFRVDNITDLAKTIQEHAIEVLRPLDNPQRGERTCLVAVGFGRSQQSLEVPLVRSWMTSRWSS